MPTQALNQDNLPFLNAFCSQMKLDTIPEKERVLYPLPEFRANHHRSEAQQPLPIAAGTYLLLIQIPDTPEYNRQTLKGYARSVPRDRYPIFLQMKAREMQFNLYILSQDEDQMLVLSGSRTLPLPGEIQQLSTHHYLTGFLMEAEDILLKRELESHFVRQFRKHWLLIAKSWRNLSTDTQETRENLSLTTLMRLLFIAFLQEKGLLNQNPHFMLEETVKCISRKHNIYAQFLVPFFFKTLNTPQASRPAYSKPFEKIPFLNGGLFRQTDEEKHNPNRTLQNQILLPILQDLYIHYHYHYDETGSCKAPENAALSTNISHQQHRKASCLDPMMLGHVFETLMQTRLRSATGSFYTPRPLSYEMSSNAISQNIAHLIHIPLEEAKHFCLHPDNYISEQHLSDEQLHQILGHFKNIKILDPSAGSGALLLHAFEHIYNIQTAIMNHLQLPFDPPSVTRQIITESLHGIDILPEAVQICELRLWLATISKYPENADNIPPLPNLDLNIRCGNTLIQKFPDDLQAKTAEMQKITQQIASLKSRYLNASATRKTRLSCQIRNKTLRLAKLICQQKLQHLQEELETYKNLEREPSLFGKTSALTKTQADDQKQCLRNIQNTQLCLQNILNGQMPDFSFQLQFPDVLQRGGFDIIIGNPPWLSMHKLPKTEQTFLKHHYQTAHTIKKSKPQPGKAISQSPEIAALFFERSKQFLHPNGTIAMILPHKLFNAPSYQPFRQFVVRNTSVIQTYDWTQNDANPFKAANYPAGILAQNHDTISDYNTETDMQAQMIFRSRPQTELSLAIQNYPRKLHEIFRVRRGMFTGANPLFIPRACRNGSSPDTIRADFLFKNNVELEKDLMKPVIRGADIHAYQCNPAQSVIFPYEENACIKPLPPLAGNWLQSHKDELQKRKDLKSNAPFYSLFRVYPELFSPKVVWRDLSHELEACFVDGNAIPLNTVYYINVSSQDEGFLLSAYLNSNAVRKYTRDHAELALGNYRRYFAWLINALPWPFPNDFTKAIIEGSQKLHQNPNDITTKQYIDELIEQSLLTPPPFEPSPTQFSLHFLEGLN